MKRIVVVLLKAIKTRLAAKDTDPSRITPRSSTHMLNIFPPNKVPILRKITRIMLVDTGCPYGYLQKKIIVSMHRRIPYPTIASAVPASDAGGPARGEPP